MKLQKILRTAGKNQTASGSRGTGFLGYTEALMSLRCLVMGAFWTFDNLNYLTLTDTVKFGVARATKGFSRSWSVASALYILLGIDSLRKVRFVASFAAPGLPLTNTKQQYCCCYANLLSTRNDPVG